MSPLKQQNLSASFPWFLVRSRYLEFKSTHAVVYSLIVVVFNKMFLFRLFLLEIIVSLVQSLCARKQLVLG